MDPILMASRGLPGLSQGEVFMKLGFTILGKGSGHSAVNESHKLSFGSLKPVIIQPTEIHKIPTGM